MSFTFNTRNTHYIVLMENLTHFTAQTLAALLVTLLNTEGELEATLNCGSCAHPLACEVLHILKLVGWPQARLIHDHNW